MGQIKISSIRPKRLLLAVGCVLLVGITCYFISACDQNPLDEDPLDEDPLDEDPLDTPLVKLNFNGSSNIGGASRAIAPSTDSVYDNYGQLIAKLTPETFVLPLVSAMLFTDSGTYDDPAFIIKDLLYDQPPDETFYADFLASGGIQYTPEVVNGTFNYFFANLHMGNGQLTYGGGGEGFTWDFQADISFTLPIEYSGITLSDYDYSVEGTTVMFTDGGQLQDNVFVDTIPSYLYIFGETDSPGVLNEEGSDIDLRDIFNQGPGLPTTNAPVIRGPFTPITIPASFQSLTIDFNFDLEEIIHLYDNNTPGDLTDDILVFAPVYWERMSVVYTLVE